MGERLADVGERRGRRLLATLGDELRGARRLSGLSQARVAALAGIPQTRVSRIERGLPPGPHITTAARLASVCGLDLTVRCFPSGGRLRDVAQLATIKDIRARTGTHWTIRAEVPVGPPPDQRAFDLTLTSDGITIAVEVISRLTDVQAAVRSARLKQAAAGVERLVIVLPATRHNRAAVAEAGLAELGFPASSRAALAALAAGRDPGGAAVVLLDARPARRREARSPGRPIPGG